MSRQGLNDNHVQEDVMMRRVNIQAAFLGEGGDSDTGDDEGLALSVRGGEIVLVLPAGTSETRAVRVRVDAARLAAARNGPGADLRDP